MTHLQINRHANVIWRFRLPLHPRTELQMPDGAQVLSVAEDHGQIALEAAVNQDNDAVRRTFLVVETGQPLPEGRRLHLGRVQIGGRTVLHVFELDTPRPGSVGGSVASQVASVPPGAVHNYARDVSGSLIQAGHISTGVHFGR